MSRPSKKVHKLKKSIVELEGTNIEVREPLCAKSASKLIRLTDEWDRVTCWHCERRRPK